MSFCDQSSTVVTVTNDPRTEISIQVSRFIVTMLKIASLFDTYIRKRIVSNMAMFKILQHNYMRSLPRLTWVYKGCLPKIRI